MRSKRKELEGRLGAFAFSKAQKYLVRKRPQKAEEIGARLGRILFKCSRKHRERAISNLALAFPDMPLAEREQLAKRTFEHFGRVTADFLLIEDRSLDDLKASLEVDGLEHIHEALSHGKGAIMITGHFGNWERMSAYVSALGYKISVIARDTADTGLNQKVNKLRAFSGTNVISRGNATRPILERLKANEMVGILPDQNSDEIFIPFFDHPAGTVLGPGVIHERTGAPVICGWCVWVGPGKYKFWIDPPLEVMPGDVKGEGTMRAIHASLERVIREYPEQWLWFHDRWKNARKRGLL